MRCAQKPLRNRSMLATGPGQMDMGIQISVKETSTVISAFVAVAKDALLNGA